MKLLQRIGYYLGGFSIGLVLLAFFLSGKRASCAYFPEDRVLKNIGIKAHEYSDEARETMALFNLDTTAVNRLISDGDVDFGESQTRKKPCGIYVINSETEDGKELQFTVENCEKLAKITTLKEVD
jgi:hypothetical protein|tara:strand:- start:66068 stop:66445 length:378 start_codon:yes stop_codon:yes gene_type:complete